MAEDKKLVGEVYWHRLHQLPGVLVCPSHNVFLEDSHARRDSARDILRFAPAEDAARILPVRPLDLSEGRHQILLRLARDAFWLLKQLGQGSDLHKLYNRYLRLLINRGLATYTGSLHVEKLLDEFERYYPTALLNLLRCEFTGADQLKTNWLLRLARPPRHAYHPLYHLLLIQFLDCTPEEFFRLPTELNFFGDGPWPCLNPAAEHFREPVIPEYKLSSRVRDGRPTANFSCGCGFAYARSGPDTSPKDKFRVGRMISFGPAWEAELERFWKDSSLSLSEVGRRLGVDTLTVRRHAARLNLPASRPAGKSKPLKRAARLKDTNGLTAHVGKRRACQVKWAFAMWQAPKTTLKALRRKLPREYAWLLQNDGEWLKAHSPCSQRSARSTSGVDWRKRDAEYAVAVRAAAANLMNKLGRPIQVTKTAIGKALGTITLLRQQLSKMPLTAQVLVRVVETREQYAIRRVRWSADLFIEEGVLPRYWQLVARANVYSLRGKPEIEAIIEAALQQLEATLLPESREKVAS
ncbi:MAG TPA: TnsD family Tn7-like transposition protein [Pyrinomonadaceae bacterium]|nr:TnsD family Tn7-like transposition protein [Pyrinomonadaceae bacterium]